MIEGRLLFLNKVDPNHPIEEKYIAEIATKRKSFMQKEDAMLYLFDNGVRRYQFLTKESSEYKDISKVPQYEFWYIDNRVGYVLYDYEHYIDENDVVKKRRAYVWRFVGFGRSCFASTKEELEERVKLLTLEHKADPKEHGYNTYPFYTRYYRENSSL